MAQHIQQSYFMLLVRKEGLVRELQHGSDHGRDSRKDRTTRAPLRSLCTVATPTAVLGCTHEQLHLWLAAGTAGAGLAAGAEEWGVAFWSKNAWSTGPVTFDSAARNSRSDSSTRAEGAAGLAAGTAGAGLAAGTGEWGMAF